MQTNQYDLTAIEPATMTLGKAWVDYDYFDINFHVMLTADSRGRFHDVVSTFRHFGSTDIDFMFKWAGDHQTFERMQQAFNLADAAKRRSQDYCDIIESPEMPPVLLCGTFIGYTAIFYPEPGEPVWNANAAPYGQHFRYNTMEILANEIGHYSKPAIGGANNSTFFGTMVPVPAQLNGAIVTIPAFAMLREFVTRLDYYIVNRDTRNPVSLPLAVALVNWRDAVLFCNNLSKREGLDTAYAYDGITPTPITGDLSRLVLDYTNLRLVPGANGYRLPTCEETAHAQNLRLAQIGSSNWDEWEWAWHSDPEDPLRPEHGTMVTSGWVSQPPGGLTRFGCLDFGEGIKRPFRVVRSLPAQSVVTGTSKEWQARFAGDQLTVVNAIVGRGESADLTAGRLIRVLPETWFERGSTVHLSIQPGLRQ